MVFGRVEGTLGLELPLWVFLEEALYEEFVFFRLDAAGAVDALTIRLGGFTGLFQQLELGVDEVAGFVRVDTPAQIESSSHDSGVGAGYVDQHAIEFLGLVGNDFFRLGNRGASDAKPITIFLKQNQTRFVLVDGSELALIFHPFGDEAGFTTGSCTEVEDRLARLRRKQIDGQQRAWILNIKKALAKRLKRNDWRMISKSIDGVGRCPIAVENAGFDVLVFPALGQGFRIGLESIEPGVGRCRLVVPLEQADSLFAAPALLPVFEKPIWVRLAKRRAVLLKSGDLAKSIFFFPQKPADDGVDESRLANALVGLGQTHAFVGNGVVGDAVEEKNLVETESEDLLHGWFLLAAIGGALDEPVEKPPPTDAA